MVVNISNLRIGKRLSIGFAVILGCMVISTGLGIVRLQETANETRQMMAVPLAKERMVSDWYRLVSTSMARTAIIAKSGDPTIGNSFGDQEQSASKAAQELIAKIQALPTSPEEQEIFKKVAIVRKNYVEVRLKVAKTQEGGSLGEAEKLYDEQFAPAAKQYEDLLRQLMEYQRTAINTTAQEIDDLALKSRNMLVGLVILVLLFGIAFARWLTLGITRPIEKAVAVARRVADGDLTTDLSNERALLAKDEVGQLLQALRDMNSNLLRIVGDVRNGTEAISTASTQIAAGNQDLSARTEQQASSLEETASSMEELTSTVKQNADNARQANQLAVTASEVAVKGGEVVSQVVSTMGSINESSKKIVDIISVIDGIAFQTNILALNAAVEAARAGEQGRGFAVVAAEVRNLAQRSAGAAKEIKELISDSVGKVDAGTKLVEQAGVTMDEVVASIRRVNDIVGEITSASQEQSGGIEQINQAITQMDQVTQQNAALVEEATAAAQSLQDQAGALSKVVATFKVNATRLSPSMASQAMAASIAQRKVEAKAKAPAALRDEKKKKPALKMEFKAPRPEHRQASDATSIPTAPAPKRTAPIATNEDDWEEF